MGIDTATVEGLSAEVRVLMVGSRQITTSVYLQLDEVPVYGIIPMGRVSVKGTDGSVILVVGKRVGGSELVRSRIPTDRGSLIEVAHAFDGFKYRDAQAAARDYEGRVNRLDSRMVDLRSKIAEYEYEGWQSILRCQERAAEYRQSAADADAENIRFRALAQAAEEDSRAAQVQAQRDDLAAQLKQIEENFPNVVAEKAAKFDALPLAQAGFDAHFRSVSQIAQEWAALKLIVLAGLR